jgi:small subunit ribosomal protein S5
MIRVPIVRDGTIPHEVNVKYKAARLRLLPASAGTGVIAGGALRVILDLAGVKDVLSKRFGTKNKLVNAQAAILALKALKQPKGMVTLDEAPKKEEKKEEMNTNVKMISRKEAEEKSKGALSE